MNLGHQVFVASAFTAEPSHQPQLTPFCKTVTNGKFLPLFALGDTFHCVF